MHRRGHTLVELLVAMAVGALILSAVVAAFVFMGRLMSWLGTRSTVDSAALTGPSRLAADLREGTYGSLTITAPPNPQAISFLMEDTSAANTNVSAFVPQNQFTIFYLDANAQNLVRKTWTNPQPPGPWANPLPTPFTFDPLSTVLSTSPFLAGRLTAAQLSAIVATLNGTEHTLSTNVVSLTFSPSTFPVPTPVNGIEVTLVVQATAPTGQVCQQTTQTLVTLRNHE